MTHKVATLVGGEHLALAVNPARGEAEGVGGVHHVAEDECAVVEAVGPDGRVGGEDKDDGGCAIVRVISGAHDGGIHGDEALDDIGVLDGDNPWVLTAMGSCGEGAGTKNGLKVVGVDLAGGVAADTTARAEAIDYLVHWCLVISD